MSEELFEMYQPLVFVVIGELRVSPTDEIIQSGLIGLWKATCNHDSEFDDHFVTYARKWITGHIIDELNRENKARLMSIYDSEGRLRFERAIEYDFHLYLEIMESYNLKDFREYLNDQPGQNSKAKSYQRTFQFDDSCS